MYDKLITGKRKREEEDNRAQAEAGFEGGVTQRKLHEKRSQIDSAKLLVVRRQTPVTRLPFPDNSPHLEATGIAECADETSRVYSIFGQISACPPTNPEAHQQSTLPLTYDLLSVNRELQRGSSTDPEVTLPRPSPFTFESWGQQLGTLSDGGWGEYDRHEEHLVADWDDYEEDYDNYSSPSSCTSSPRLGSSDPCLPRISLPPLLEANSHPNAVFGATRNRSFESATSLGPSPFTSRSTAKSSGMQTPAGVELPLYTSSPMRIMHELRSLPPSPPLSPPSSMHTFNCDTQHDYHAYSTSQDVNAWELEELQETHIPYFSA